MADENYLGMLLAQLGSRGQRPLFGNAGAPFQFGQPPQPQQPPNTPFGMPNDLGVLPTPPAVNAAAPLPFMQAGNDRAGVRGGGPPPVVTANPGDGAAALIGTRPAPNYAVVTNPSATPSQEITSGSSLSIANGPDTQQFNPEGRQVGGGMVGSPMAPFSPSTQTPSGYGPQLALLDAIRSRAMQDTPVVIGGGSMEDFGQQMARRGQAMSGLLQNALPNILNNNLGQGELGLRGTELLGAPGISGRLGIAQQEADTRAQENERYGPSARYDSFYTQAYGAFPPGTPHDARVRQLQQQGMPPPQFLAGGRPQPGGQPPIIAGGAPSPAGSVRDMYGIANPAAPAGSSPVPGMNPIDQAFEMGMSAFPRNPQTGVRQVPADNPQAIQQAITRIISGIPDDRALQANFPALQQRLTQEFGADALDQWMNTSNNFWNQQSGANAATNTQVDRMLRMAGMQRTPSVAGSQNLGFLENLGRRWQQVSPLGRGLGLLGR